MTGCTLLKEKTLAIVNGLRGYAVYQFFQPCNNGLVGKGIYRNAAVLYDYFP